MIARRSVPVCLTMLLCLSADAAAFAPDEQESILEQTLAVIAAECGGSYDPVGHRLMLPGKSAEPIVLDFTRAGFGSTAAASVDDHVAGRQHPSGSTVLGELADLSAEDMKQFLQADGDEAPGGNVTARFLAHHWRALRWAREARGAEASDAAPQLEAALLEEALALSHLMDAFSSSHFFHPGGDPLDWLHRTNNRDRRERLRFMGVYVMDSRGEVWMSFGDGLLHWYPHLQERVEEAVRVALREFFAVYFADEIPPALQKWRTERSPGTDPAAWTESWLETADGTAYYEELRLPSLSRIPMAVAATWSERDDSRIEHGIARRRHWPQLREEGEHDPELRSSQLRWLPSEDAVPSWLRFPRLASSTPEKLILGDPDVASVRFQQERNIPPTFRGGLLLASVGRDLAHAESSWLLCGGVGWGIVDEILPLRRLLVFQRMSVEFRANWNPDAADAYGVLACTMQLDSGTLPGAIHLEFGVADGWQGRYESWGFHLGAGWATRSIKIPGIYAGGMMRLRYTVGTMGEAVHSLLLDVLIH